MSHKAQCRTCESWTSSVWARFIEGEACPFCHHYEDGSLEKVADLEFRSPECPVCPDGIEVSGDGSSWWCEQCGSSWAADGTGGKRR